MKARIKFVANFSWEFAEIEFSDEVEKKINCFAEIVRERLLSVLGFEPEADIHWQIEIQQPKFYDFQDFMSAQQAGAVDASPVASGEDT